jgi:hypothetical protein
MEVAGAAASDSTAAMALVDGFAWQRWPFPASDRIGSATRAAKVGQRRRRGGRTEPEVPREGRRSGRRRVWLGEDERSAERETDNLWESERVD